MTGIEIMQKKIENYKGHVLGGKATPGYYSASGAGAEESYGSRYMAYFTDLCEMRPGDSLRYQGYAANYAHFVRMPAYGEVFQTVGKLPETDNGQKCPWELVSMYSYSNEGMRGERYTYRFIKL